MTEFDDMLRERLKNFNSEVPDDMWSRIVGKNKRRRFLFIPFTVWMLFGILLTASVTFYFLYTANDKLNNKNVPEKSNEQTAEEKSTGKNIDSYKEKTTTTKHSNEQKLLEPAIGNISKKKLANDVALYQSTAAVTDSTDMGTNNAGALNNNGTVIFNIDSSDIASSAPVKNEKPLRVKKDSTELSYDNDSTDAADEQGKNDKFSLELYASPMFALNNMNAANVVYSDLLKRSIKTGFSYSFGARIDIRINKNFSFKTGIEYQQVSMRMKFYDSTLSGDVSSGKNRYRNFNVPLLLSYNTKLFTAINTSFIGGIMLNVSSVATGKLPDIYGGTVSLDAKNVYDNHTLQSVYMGASFSSNISDRSFIFMQPYFQFRLKNMTNSFQPFTQKINTTGIEIGWRYKLFKEEEN